MNFTRATTAPPPFADCDVCRQISATVLAGVARMAVSGAAASDGFSDLLKPAIRPVSD